VDTTDPAVVLGAMHPEHEDAVRGDADESTLRITDIAGMAKLANERRTTLVVDNTFLTPYLQRPIELGAHIVVHSMTKYMNGHSDADGRGGEFDAAGRCGEDLFSAEVSGSGTCADGLLSGFARLKTLACGCCSTMRMVWRFFGGRHLDAHPKVRSVLPGLATHPQHELARRQQKGPGAMIALIWETRGRARRFFKPR